MRVGDGGRAGFEHGTPAKDWQDRAETPFDLAVRHDLGLMHLFEQLSCDDDAEKARLQRRIAELEETVDKLQAELKRARAGK